MSNKNLLDTNSVKIYYILVYMNNSE